MPAQNVGNPFVTLQRFSKDAALVHSLVGVRVIPAGRCLPPRGFVFHHGTLCRLPRVDILLFNHLLSDNLQRLFQSRHPHIDYQTKKKRSQKWGKSFEYVVYSAVEKNTRFFPQFSYWQLLSGLSGAFVGGLKNMESSSSITIIPEYCYKKWYL